MPDSLFISTLQLFGAACRVYSPSDVRPVVELGDSLKQEGVVNPLPALMNSSEGKYTGQAALKSCKVESMTGSQLYNLTILLACKEIF